jgi:hypothetical protein
MKTEPCMKVETEIKPYIRLLSAIFKQALQDSLCFKDRPASHPDVKSARQWLMEWGYHAFGAGWIRDRLCLLGEYNIPDEDIFLKDIKLLWADTQCEKTVKDRMKEITKTWKRNHA